MKSIKSITERYPVISAVITALLMYTVMNGVSYIIDLFPDCVATDYFHEIVSMIYPIGFVFLFGFSSYLRKTKGFAEGLICGMAMLAGQVFLLTANIVRVAQDSEAQWASPAMLILGIITVIGIGIREECFFRVIIHNILAKKYANTRDGIVLTALLCGTVFGLVHLFNLFVAPWTSVVPQSLANIGIGMFFSAVYLRSGNVWSLVLIHAIIDAAGLFDNFFVQNGTFTESLEAIGWGSLGGSAMFMFISLFLLRKSKCDRIIQRQREETEALSNRQISA